MDTRRLEQLHQSLRNLVANYRATVELAESALAVLDEELALDPLTYFQSRHLPAATPPGAEPRLVDGTMFSVNFRGQTCFLGNNLPFKFFARLAERPNTYVSYEDLLADVWGRKVSDAAVRSVVKALRRSLRRKGLGDLADAIDGSAAGHYALRLDP